MLVKCHVNLIYLNMINAHHKVEKFVFNLLVSPNFSQSIPFLSVSFTLS